MFFALFSLLHVDMIVNAGTHFLLADPSSSTITTNTSSNTLAGDIRGYIAPLLLLGIGIVAISFLVQRQMTQFFQFLALAVVVAAIFYAPDFIATLGTTLSGWFGNGN